MAAGKIQIIPILRKTSSLSSRSETPPEQGQDAAQEPKEKKKRASKPKVRSGCVTCKIRRIKCDEAKPECSRCISTGRKCDGYEIKPRKKRSDCLTINKPLPVINDIGPAELRSLGFFHHKSAPSLSSYFDAEFWTRLVFQMSYVEPSVRHAMIALGALHEERERGIKLLPLQPQMNDPGSRLTLKKTDVGTKASQGNRFALTQYSKAILQLSQRMEDDNAVEVALLACILFVCIEFIRGDTEPAIKHFRSGMGIALTAIAQKDSTTPPDTLERIRNYMLPFLNRIELLSTLFGAEASWSYPVDLSTTVPKEFYSVREARDSIVHLGNLSIRFIKNVRNRKYVGMILPDDLCRQSALLRQLELWSQKLDEMLLLDTVTVKDLAAAKTLRIHQLVAMMWLRRSTQPNESCNDENMAEFETAVELAEAIQATAGEREQRLALGASSFLFDMEIVSPLYYVATKCRHPQFRRRAISVLKKSHRREGLWDSDMAAAVAQRQVELEETSLTVLDGSELPAEKDRIHDIQIGAPLGAVSSKTILTFYTIPNGVAGPWKIWKEELSLE